MPSAGEVSGIGGFAGEGGRGTRGGGGRSVVTEARFGGASATWAWSAVGAAAPAPFAGSTGLWLKLADGGAAATVDCGIIGGQTEAYRATNPSNVPSLR